VVQQLRIVLAVGLLAGVWMAATGPVALTQDSAGEAELIERSSDVFRGRIDIQTRTAGSVSAYTVLVDEVLKGDLKPQSIVVVQFENANTLVPGAEYLFLTRYEPALLRYVAVDALAIEHVDQRNALVQHWTELAQETSCAYTDVLVLDGAVYARRDWNGDKRYLEREWVGPSFATVSVQDTSATGCRDDLADGTASEIPAGTKVHELDGYATTFRVAVRLPDRHRYLYEVIWSNGARVGADLLDIRGRVRSIVWANSTDCPENAECDTAPLSTDNPEVISNVVDLLMTGPIEKRFWDVTTDGDNELYIQFVLENDSPIHLWIDEQTELTNTGIRVPFEKILNALDGRR
jgi:hypothetical protein